MKKSFYVYGSVQAVMFRKTFCYAALDRKLEGGATNDRANKDRVLCSLVGEVELIEFFLNDLKSLEKLNSWGAKVIEIEELPDFIEVSKHEVNTNNVYDTPKNLDIEFYLK